MYYQTLLIFKATLRGCYFLNRIAFRPPIHFLPKWSPNVTQFEQSSCYGSVLRIMHIAHWNETEPNVCWSPPGAEAAERFGHFGGCDLVSADSAQPGDSGQSEAESRKESVPHHTPKKNMVDSPHARRPRTRGMFARKRSRKRFTSACSRGGANVACGHPTKGPTESCGGLSSE